MKPLPVPPAGRNVLKHIEFKVRTLDDVREAQAQLGEWVVAAAEERWPGLLRRPLDEILSMANANAQERWGVKEYQTLIAALAEAEREVIRDSKEVMA